MNSFRNPSRFQLAIYELRWKTQSEYNVRRNKIYFIAFFFPSSPPAASAPLRALCAFCAVKYKMIKLSEKPDILKIKSTSLWWFRKIVVKSGKSESKEILKTYEKFPFHSELSLVAPHLQPSTWKGVCHKKNSGTELEAFITKFFRQEKVI